MRQRAALFVFGVHWSSQRCFGADLWRRGDGGTSTAVAVDSRFLKVIQPALTFSCADLALVPEALHDQLDHELGNLQRSNRHTPQAYIYHTYNLRCDNNTLTI